MPRVVRDGKGDCMGACPVEPPYLEALSECCDVPPGVYVNKTDKLIQMVV